MKDFVLKVPYGLAKLSTPEYWFDNDKIHSNSGAIIGYPHRAVTEDEALAFGAYGLNVCLTKDKTPTKTDSNNNSSLDTHSIVLFLYLRG